MDNSRFFKVHNYFRHVHRRKFSLSLSKIPNFYFSFFLQLNVACMIGCCGCTKSSCYQDKDKIEYYVGGSHGSYSKVNEEQRI